MPQEAQTSAASPVFAVNHSFHLSLSLSLIYYYGVEFIVALSNKQADSERETAKSVGWLFVVWEK